MNEARVKNLAKEGKIEFTRKMFRRLLREEIDAAAFGASIAKGDVSGENIYSDPDFSFSMRLPEPYHAREAVCVQTADGKAVRVVGFYQSRKKAKK